MLELFAKVRNRYLVCPLKNATEGFSLINTFAPGVQKYCTLKSAQNLFGSLSNSIAPLPVVVESC